MKQRPLGVVRVRRGGGRGKKTDVLEREHTLVNARGLILDYGGVLTSSIGKSFRRFEDAEALEPGTIFKVIGRAYQDPAARSSIAQIERGQIDPSAFEELLHKELARLGHEVTRQGLRTRLLGGMEPEGSMWDVVAVLRTAGVKTALLSNSWGIDSYPRDRLDAHFDVLVISGEEGMRKPDPEIYTLTAHRLGLEPEDCVFVDDLDMNVAGATAVGMHGIHHVETAATVAQISTRFGIDLAAALNAPE